MNTYRVSNLYPLTPTDTCGARFGYAPRATYAAGAERVITIAGTTADVGYPRATWTFAALTVAQWSAWQTLVGGYSGTVYIETRDDEDSWHVYRAVARLPDPATLDRWGGYYRNVTIELVLVATLV
jgi:hypothetical protein